MRFRRPLCMLEGATGRKEWAQMDRRPLAPDGDGPWSHFLRPHAPNKIDSGRRPGQHCLMGRWAARFPEKLLPPRGLVGNSKLFPSSFA